METETELTKDLIEQNWPIDGVRIGELLRKSGGSRVGIIESDHGRYIYKIAHTWKTSTTIERDLTTFDFLNDVGFNHISRLLKTKNGKAFVTINNNQLIYLIEYIDGVHPDNSAKTYGELGRITGVLHKVANFPFETDFNADIVVQDLKKNSGNFEFGEEYLKVVGNLPSFQGLPKTLIHTDISPTNTIQNKEGDFIVIDWDEAG
ncbi:MAG: aminoglycoside phosphotransferase family protein, partial [Patescibacteria group bacterium]